MKRSAFSALLVAALTLPLYSVAYAHGFHGGGHMGGARMGAMRGGNFSGHHFGGRPFLAPRFGGAPFVHRPFGFHGPFVHRRIFIAAPILAPAFVPRIYGAVPYGYAPPTYWYYCPEFGAYYPTVTDCPGPWQPVLPY